MTEPLSGALMCEAMRLARLEVKHSITDQGLRIKDYEAKEIRPELVRAERERNLAEFVSVGGPSSVGFRSQKL